MINIFYTKMEEIIIHVKTNVQIVMEISEQTADLCIQKTDITFSENASEIQNFRMEQHI